MTMETSISNYTRLSFEARVPPVGRPHFGSKRHDRDPNPNLKEIVSRESLLVDIVAMHYTSDVKRVVQPPN